MYREQQHAFTEKVAIRDFFDNYYTAKFHDLSAHSTVHSTPFQTFLFYLIAVSELQNLLLYTSYNYQQK